MNALDLVHELSAHGVRVEVSGDCLSLEGPPEVLTDEMTERLRQHKPQLLSLYGRQIHGVRLADLRHLAGADWPDLEADPNLLEAFAAAVQARQMREKGHIPYGWTERHMREMWPRVALERRSAASTGVPVVFQPCTRPPGSVRDGCA